jgi:hypothetical protein
MFDVGRSMFDVHSFLLSIKLAASGSQRSACGGTSETFNGN